MSKIFSLGVVAFLSASCYGQLCSGSLGDPVAWTTFGGGGNVIQLPAYKTNYTYVRGCPDDGEYTFTDITFGCFNSTWHTIVGDHTPDDNIGVYMLVNASKSPGVFYTDTINGLCSNTTYELSAWVMNVLKINGCTNPILPNLTFSIETLSGAQLITYNSGDIPMTESPTWKQFGTFFRTPANNSSVVFRIMNNAPGGCGNDLALDDIMFRPCGPMITAELAATGSNEVNVCLGSEVPYLLIGSYSGGYTNPNFQWQEITDIDRTWKNIPGATSRTYLRQPKGVGNFKYRLTIAEGSNINISECRIGSEPISININPPPFVQATNYVFSCYGSTVILFAAGGMTYEWTGPNGFASNIQQPAIPNVQFNNAGLYKVKVTTHTGCAGSDSTNLVIYPAAHAGISEDISICEGETAQLHATGGIKYGWFPSKDLSNDTIPDPIAKPLDSTTYRVILFNEYGCFDTARVHVNVWKKPIADAGPDLKMLIGKPIHLKGKSGGTLVNFNWTPVIYVNQQNTLRPQVNPPETMSFRLEVNSRLGCGTSTDDVIVKVYEKLPIPNAFSPNGDGINDKWIIELIDNYPGTLVEVYNRYGQLVFRSIGYNKPWDGTYQNKPVPAGTYYYIIDLKNGIQKNAGFIDVLR